MAFRPAKRGGGQCPLNPFHNLCLPPPRLLLTPRETAKVMGICEKTLWSLTKKGELPAVRIGRSVRYAISDLRAFVDRKKGVRHDNANKSPRWTRGRVEGSNRPIIARSAEQRNPQTFRLAGIKPHTAILSIRPAL